MSALCAASGQSCASVIGGHDAPSLRRVLMQYGLSVELLASRKMICNIDVR